MARASHRWKLAELALMLLVSACAGGEDATGAASCSGNEPIECRTPEGDLVGCCPNALPICSPDGHKCLDFGSGGSDGSAPN